MEFNKFMTLWIFSLCLVEKSWTERTGSSNSEIQVGENGVSGKILIILLMCENRLLLYFVYAPVDFSREKRTACWLGMYSCSCHISVMVQALYVALLRIGQLALPVKHRSGKFTSSTQLNFRIHCILLFILPVTTSMSANLSNLQLKLI